MGGYDVDELFELPVRLHQEVPRPMVAGVAVRHYGERRRCQHPECDTHLSRYNPSEQCARHAGWQDHRRRAAPA